MKTRIPIDTDLLQQALATTGCATTREVVEAALRALLRASRPATAELRDWQMPLPSAREELAA